MQVDRYPKIVAFIEGSMERMFVNNNFHYVHVVTINNGEGWSLEAMCRQIASKFSVISYIPDYVIVWFDRENMPHTSKEISNSVRSSVVDRGYPSRNLAILIADKMTENIILADEIVIKSEFDLSEYKYPGDGTNGKATIGSLYRDKGIKYKETHHGAYLLKKTRIARAAKSSESARLFHGELNLGCWWKKG